MRPAGSLLCDPERSQVAVGHVLKARNGDQRPSALEPGDQAIEQPRDLLSVVEPEPGLPDELRVPAAARIESR